CQFTGAERGSPNPDERRQSLTDARRRSVQAAHFRIGPDGADEGYSRQRSYSQEQHPPGPRHHQLAAFLVHQPEEGGLMRAQETPLRGPGMAWGMAPAHG